MAANIRGIGFDIGGVLLGSERPQFYRYCQEAFGVPAEEIEPVLVARLPRLERGEEGIEEFWKSVAGDLGVDYRPDYLDLWNRDYEQNTPMDQGVFDLAQRLKAAHYRIGVLSNTHAEHADINRHRHFFEKFDCVLLSNEIRAIKPEPKAFQLLCDALGTAPAETVFVDDLAENITGAEAVGLIGIKFTGVTALTERLGELGLKF